MTVQRVARLEDGWGAMDATIETRDRCVYSLPPRERWNLGRIVGRDGPPHAGQHFETHTGDSRTDQAEASGRGVRDIHDPALAKRTSIVDSNHGGAPVPQIGDADASSERKRAMRGGHAMHVEGLAARGRAAVEIRPIVRRQPLLAGGSFGESLAGTREPGRDQESCGVSGVAEHASSINRDGMGGGRGDQTIRAGEVAGREI